jgi:dihydroxyacetone kinase-like predicted kinase
MIAERRSEAFIKAVEEQYEAHPFETPLLEEAARILDRIDELAGELREHGLVDTGSKGQRRVSPLVAELRQQQLALARVLNTLIVPEEDPK